MPRRKIGSITALPNGRYLCRVQRGTRSDGTARVASKTVDTREEAEIACAQMAAELGGSLAAADNLTLAQYYYGVFRDAPSSRGTVRSKGTLRDYDGQMERFVLPAIGDRPISGLTHAEIKAAVLSSTEPAKCKRTLRAVLNAAYADELIDEKPMQRRIVTPQRKRQQIAAWSAPEVAAAMEAMREEPAWMECYLVLGLSGLRLEESLGIRPVDVRAERVYDFATGGYVDTVTVQVCRTYTDDDGLKEGAKNSFSLRTVPVFVPERERLLDLLTSMRPEDPTAAEEWAHSRIVPLGGRALAKAWAAALDRRGLRRIPPDMLRHTSETMMQAADLPDTLVSRLHGHATLATDYRNYMRPGAAEAERAARAVSDLVPVRCISEGSAPTGETGTVLQG